VKDDFPQDRAVVMVDLRLFIFGSLLESQMYGFPIVLRGVFGNHSIMRLRKQKSEYHPRPCFEALTYATNLIIRQIQGKAARKASRKD